MTQRKYKRLFLDLETSPNIVYSWRLGAKVFLDHQNMIHERAIICACWKWEGQTTVHHLSWDANHSDKTLLQHLVPVLDAADEIVAHYGSRFDIPWVKTRCMLHQIPCGWEYKVVDTCTEARLRFYLNSTRLDYIAKFLGREGKIQTDFSWWLAVLNDSPGALTCMVRYCQQDVRELEAVYHRLAPYIKGRSHRGVAEGGSRWQCPHCGSEHVRLNKTRPTAAGILQHWMNCQDCHRYYPLCTLIYEQMLEERISLPIKETP